MPPDDRLILVTGATGYVGGRLLHELERRGHRVRCLARRPDALRGRVGEKTEVVKGDVQVVEDLETALVGVHTAYYLVHSMGSRADFETRDREAADNFKTAAVAAGVQRIVYLGGLGEASESLSAHLRSRHEVGEILRASGPAAVELRASIVLGSGSLSFEIVRALVERLPVMITPRWVRVEAQPILITDVIQYLVAALDLPPHEGGIVEIGGEDRCTYEDIMREYAKQRGLRRVMVSIPLLTPRLSSLWLGLVTPVYARVGRKLIASIRHPTIVINDRARGLFPTIRPAGLREAIERALRQEEEAFAETRWCDAMSSAGNRPANEDVRFGPRVGDVRTRHVASTAAQAFAPIRRIGGRTGWYFGDWLWRLRGHVDLLAGGVGLRRGRRDPEHPHVGEPLDFWRVDAYEPDRRLRLRAEMKLPGRAWLEFEVVPEEGGTTIHQTAVFDPVGLWGRVYWTLLKPAHHIVFGGMLRAIARQATAAARSPLTQGTRDP